MAIAYSAGGSLGALSVMKMDKKRNVAQKSNTGKLDLISEDIIECDKRSSL